MGNPRIPEPTPERGDRTPERHARRRRVKVGIAGGATALVGGALLLAQMRDTRQESLPEPPSLSVASETMPTPVTPEGFAPAHPTAPSSVSAPASAGKNTAGKKSVSERKIDEARAQARADGFSCNARPRPMRRQKGGRGRRQAVDRTDQERCGTGVDRAPGPDRRIDVTPGRRSRQVGRPRRQLHRQDPPQPGRTGHRAAHGAAVLADVVGAQRGDADGDPPRRAVGGRQRLDHQSGVGQAALIRSAERTDVR